MEPLRRNDPGTIGGHELVGRLGSGGMGQVFLARRPDGALVALKLIHADLADDPVFRARFAREVAMARRVDGPYTAALLDHGDAPRPWLTTAYLPGLTLGQAVERHGRLSAATTRRLGIALAEALEAIHRAGVVHRDLKPANVLLTADGPRVVDFGIARGLDGGTLTGGGVLVGTPAYMAPEQVQGAPVTPATDVFALGRCLAYACTASQLDDQGLGEVIAACLAEDPGARPDLRTVIARLSVDAPTGTGWLPGPLAQDIADRAKLGSSRRRVLLEIAGVGAAALAGGGAVLLLSGDSPRKAPVRWSVRADGVLAQAFGPYSPGRLYVVDRPLVTTPGQAPRAMLRCLEEKSGRTLWQQPVEPFAREGQPMALASSVWLRERQSVQVVDSATGAPRWQATRAFSGLRPAVLAGRNLVFDAGRSPNTVFAHDPNTGRVVWERRLRDEPLDIPALAGNLLCVIAQGSDARQGHIHALDAATGTPRWEFHAPTAFYNGGTLAASGDTLYVSFHGVSIHALDPATGRSRWRTAPKLDAAPDQKPSDYPSAALPVITGDTLLVGTGDGVLRAFATRDGRQRWAFPTGAFPLSVNSDPGYITPLVRKGTVFVRGPDHVHALRATDGKLKWKHPTDPSAPNPVLTKHAIHIPGRWEVTSHDPASGRLLQRLDLRPQGLYPAALAAGREHLFVLAGPHTVLAIALP